jgi:hypothetical protein
MITFLFWLTIKHFICDFPLQAFPWMYRNKGTYGHPGGLVHAAIHGIGTALIILFLLPTSFLWIAILDAILHYHIDFGKVQLTRRFNLKPDNSEWFWILLGIDQLLHSLTYFWFVFIVF